MIHFEKSGASVGKSRQVAGECAERESCARGFQIEKPSS